MLTFGSGLILSSKTWAALKTAVSSRNLLLQYDEDATAYSIFALDGLLTFHTIIFKGAVPAVCDITQEENDVAKAEFETSYKTSANKRLGDRMDSEARLRVSPEPRKEGDQLIVVSHNWCDPCTWYQQSVRVTGETLDAYGDGYSFQSAHAHWIDLTHGRFYREDLVSATYKPKVYVDGYQVVERAPFADSGGDFAVDYVAGTVAFFSSQAGKVVTVDYSWENGSVFIVAPTAGKKLWVERTEVQFSADVVINDSTSFQAWAYNPYNPPNKVPVTSKTTYKTARDYVDEANGVYPVVPAFGGQDRGLLNSHLVFPYNYLQIKELKSSQGVEIRVWLESNIPFGGEFGTVTFYCTSYTE